MHKRFFILPGLLLAYSSASAQEPLACSNSLNVGLAERAEAEDLVSVPGTIVFETGQLDALFSEPRSASLSGGIILRSDDKLAAADSAELLESDRRVFLQGDVRYEDQRTEIRSDSAEFAYDSGVIEFTGAEFSVGEGGRGEASALRISEDGVLNLGGVSYTTCPPGSDDWLLKAKSIRMDTRNGVGTAEGIRLRFKGVQLLYAPYLSFPIGDARKSGFLTPEIGSSNRGGNDIRVPYYWNIAPNYDATLTGRLLTDRGFLGQTQFRYLFDAHDGTVNAELLPSDDQVDGTRHLFDFDHRSLFSNGWRSRVDVRDVSDSQYFEDLGGSLSISSLTHLNRSVEFDYYGRHWTMLGRVQDFQTLDDAIADVNEPYRRLPQFVAKGAWPDRWLGADLDFDSELVNFDRDVGVTGWRFNAAPQVSRRFGGPGWFIKPAVRLDHTRYALSDLGPGEVDDPNRTLPISSLDAGVVLERTLENSPQFLQTIEPRMLYVHIPHRGQDELPVFDTIAPDLNLVQLFRRDRVLGVDRIIDTDQLSVGVTSRLLDVGTGRELVSATIGQALYLSTSGVSLPGQTVQTSRSSDYIAEVSFLLYDNINFDFGHQWGTGDQGTTQSEARLQYSPASNKVFNVAYRFRRDALEQGDVSWSWPINRRWNFVGRYNYSFRDDEVLERFAGLEYESCCWGLRIVSRSFISTRDGTRDSSIGLQLVLKGLSSVGSQSDKLLERGILGYSARLR
ncbi:MAG: LPS assembly protein LptD [Pseudomonadota bacterium]